MIDCDNSAAATRKARTMAFISVIIATHNYAQFLPHAICSVQAQTFTDWECIIVDDCSTDNTAELVARFIEEDDRIRYIRNSQNQGEAGSRNIGNGVATGEWIAVLDADDWWEPSKLQVQLDALQQNPGTIFCFTSKFDVRGDNVSIYKCEAHYTADLEANLRVQNDVTHSSVVVHRDALHVVGGYDQTMPYCVDWDLWLKLLHRYGAATFVYIEDTLVYYRIHDNNMTSNWRRVCRGDWAAVCKMLLRDGWGIRHPVVTWRTLDNHLGFYVQSYRRAGEVRNAFLLACFYTLLSPIRRWRWLAAAKILRGH